MFAILGSDNAAIRRAARECGLVFVKGDTPPFSHDGLPPGDLPAFLQDGPREPEAVIALSPASAGMSVKEPNVIGLFRHDGCYYIIWDAHRDGRGLHAYIGRRGERFRLTYILEALDTIMPKLGFLRKMGASADAEGNLLLEFTDAMQKQIKVRVAPTGGVTIETSGFKGKECLDATKQLEQALGTVTADTPKVEQYAPPETTTTIGSGT